MAGLHAKLDRARELIPILQGEIDDYYASNPVVLRLQHREDPKCMEAVAESVRQPPLRLGVLMGEFTHNLRSTLDQLVWDLQPFHSEQPEVSALRILRELHNEDKHRVILQPVSVPKDPGESNVRLDAHDVEVTACEVMVGAPLEPGATVVRVPYAIIGDAPRLHLDVAFPAEVHFGKIGFRALAMHSVAEKAAGVVRGFEPFFT